MDIQALKATCRQVRRDIVTMCAGAGSGHPGGSLSCTEALVALYFDVMKVDPKNPKDPARDRFVLSKGHCGPALYAPLALRGFFPMELLDTMNRGGTDLPSHSDRLHTPGVDMSTGSLGQGLSAAVGMAIAGKMDSAAYRVYALMGDGEIEEGQIWEAAMSAAKYKLDNLCGIVDVNGLQIDGRTADVMPSEPLDAKFAAFGWNVIKADGHDFDSLRAALAAAKAEKGRPSVILAKTVKGKGVSFMENDPGWHGKAPNAEQYEQAMTELNAAVEKLEVE